MWRQRNRVHGSQAPNWGSYLEGYLYLGKEIQREMQIGMGEVREENRELSVDELVLRCPRASQWTCLKSASLLAFERWLVSVGGDRNYYHNHYNSSSITGTLLGGSISINSNSHNNYDKEALFSRDEETGLNRSIISPRLHDWPVKWDSHPLPPLLTFSPLPSNTLRLFTKMAAGIPPIPVCPFVIWTCCLSRRDLGGGGGRDLESGLNLVNCFDQQSSAAWEPGVEEVFQLPRSPSRNSKTRSPS